MLRLVASVLLVATVAVPARAEPASPRAVVELFTSQGCSASPPADAVVADLAKDPGIIALTLPVTYWDYLGWKDTLADAIYGMRQRAYAQARGDGQIYTPQLVVNGLMHVVGSDRGAVERSITATRGRLGALTVPITVGEQAAVVTVHVGASAQPNIAHKGTLWLLPVVKRRAVTVDRGENKDHRLSYTNVVRRIMRMGEWNGQPLSFEMPLPMAKPQGAEGYVVLLQAYEDGKLGAILGAAKGPGL